MNAKVYKSCGVPLCKNTSIKTPKKLFVYVPNKKTIRYRWLTLARRDPFAINLSTPIYFCEDHFDLPNDMENYMQYHVMGSVSQVRMKSGCVPRKFDCQSDRRKQLSNNTKRQLKIQRMLLIKEYENNIIERSTVRKKLLQTKISYECSDNLTTVDSGQHSYDNSKCDMLQTVPFPEVPNDFQNAVMNADGQDSKMCLQNMLQSSADIYNPGGYEPGTVCLGANGTVAATTNDDMEMSNSMSHKQTFGGELGLDMEYCSECNGELVGCVYVCVQCARCAVCAACEVRGAHRHHYALRVPSHKPRNEVKMILEKIRSILEQETLAEDNIVKEQEACDSYGSEWQESSFVVKIEPQDTIDEVEPVPQTDEDTSTDMYSDTQNESPTRKSARKRFRPNILKKTTRRLRSIVDDRHVCEPEIQITVEEVDGDNQGLSYSTRYEQASSSNTSCETDLVPIMETNKDSRMLIPIYMSKSQSLKSNDLKNLQIKPDPLISVPPDPTSESHSEESSDPLLTADPLLIKTESPD